MREGGKKCLKYLKRGWDKNRRGEIRATKFHGQSISQTWSIEEFKKMRTSSIFCIFCQFLDVIGQHSLVKRHGTYIFFERTFYWLSYPFYKIQKTVFDFEKYIFWQYPNFLWFLLMLAKTRGAMATNYIPVDSIWQVLPVYQVSWSQH